MALTHFEIGKGNQNPFEAPTDWWKPILESATVPIRSSAAKSLLSFTIGVSKWITHGKCLVEFHCLNEDIYLSTSLRTKQPQGDFQKFDLHHFAPPKALVLCNNFNSSSAAASLDVMEKILPKTSHVACSSLNAAYQKSGWKWIISTSENKLNKWLEPERECPINTFSINFHLRFLGV